MVAMTCTSVTVSQVDGELYLQAEFANGTGFEGPLRSFQETIDSFEIPHIAAHLLIAWWLARSPNMSNEALIEGKTLTLDFSAANPMRIQ